LITECDKFLAIEDRRLLNEDHSVAVRCVYSNVVCYSCKHLL
jgi:hypothetical protein